MYILVTNFGHQNRANQRKKPNRVKPNQLPFDSANCVRYFRMKQEMFVENSYKPVFKNDDIPVFKNDLCHLSC